MADTNATTVPARLARTPEDYARIGIEPGAIKLWEDGMRTDGSPGTYEWWYFDAHLDDGAKLVVVFLTKEFTPCAARPTNTYILEHAKGLILFDTARSTPRGPRCSCRSSAAAGELKLEATSDPAVLRISPAPLLRLRGGAGRRSRFPAQPRVSLRLRRPERGAAEGAPSSAQGRLSILSLCAKAWEAPSPRAVSTLQPDGHARGSRRHGAGTRQTPAASWLHGVRGPLRRSLAQGCGYMATATAGLLSRRELSPDHTGGLRAKPSRRFRMTGPVTACR